MTEVTDAMVEAGAKQMRAVLDVGGYDDTTAFVTALETIGLYPMREAAPVDEPLVERVREHIRRLGLARQTHAADVLAICSEALPDFIAMADHIEARAALAATTPTPEGE